MIGDPLEMTGWMLLVTGMGFAICAMGVQKGVERITKYMMAALFIFMAILCVRSCLLEGGEEGLAFYLLLISTIFSITLQQVFLRLCMPQ